MAKRTLTFSPQGYERSLAEYRQNWFLLDDELYHLCREHPDHLFRPSVYAKAFIIGRTYTTGIERLVRSRRSQGSSMTQVSEHLFDHGEEVDRMFDRIRVLQEPLNAPKLREIVIVHGEMVRLLSSITIGRQSPRTFVSKYMHFHNPIVPIYDSYAADRLPRFVRWSQELKVFETPTNADSWYVEYVLRFLRLYERIRSQFSDVTVRKLDTYLLAGADSP